MAPTHRPIIISEETNLIICIVLEPLELSNWLVILKYLRPRIKSWKVNRIRKYWIENERLVGKQID